MSRVHTKARVPRPLAGAYCKAAERVQLSLSAII